MMPRRIVQGNRVVLVENAVYGHIRDYLIQDELLNMMEVETVDAEKTRHEKISKLLDIMWSKPDDHIARFLATLARADPIMYSQLNLFPADPSGASGGGADARGSSGALSKIQKELRAWYTDTLSRLHPIPWCEWLELDLDHVFTNLEVASARKHQINLRSSRDKKSISGKTKPQGRTNGIQHHQTVPNEESSSTMDTVTLLRNVFSQSEKRTVCFIEGPAGIGKSTLSRRLLHLWAKDGCRIHGRHFDLVLCLTARTLTGDLKSSIFQQLFTEDFCLSEDEIYQCLVDNQRNSLLIIDGLDELTQEGKGWVMKLLSGGMLRHVNLLLTGRPEASRVFVRHANVHLLLKGFTADNVRSYVGKYFGDDQPEYKAKLLDGLKKDFQLQLLANNPFTTLLLCLLVQDNEGDIPSTSTEIYLQVISASCRRYAKKRGNGGQCSKSELFKAAAHLAYTWLTLGVSVFPEKDIAAVCYPGFERHLLDSGILNRDFTLSRLHVKGYCYFPHKSFQEYLCAWFLSHLSSEELSEKLVPLSMGYGSDINMYRYLLSMLKGRDREIKAVLESMCDKVGAVQHNSDIVVVERLRWLIQLAYGRELGASMIDFLADRISRRDILVRAVGHGTFYGYWAGELLECINKVLAKVKLKPVAILDAKVSSFHNGNHQDACVFGHTDDHLNVTHHLFLDLHGELLATSQGPRSLSASPSETLPWSCLHCGRVKSATNVLQKGVRTSILSVALFHDRQGLTDLVDMADCLESLDLNITVLVLVIDQIHSDQLRHCVSIPNGKSANRNGSRYHFLKLRPTYRVTKECDLDTRARSIRGDCILKSSIQELYYSRFCPY